MKTLCHSQYALCIARNVDDVAPDVSEALLFGGKRNKLMPRLCGR
jgi:hypothetical protein